MKIFQVIKFRPGLLGFLGLSAVVAGGSPTNASVPSEAGEQVPDGRVLSDREQLYDLQIRYARAADLHDRELMRTVLTDQTVRQYDPFGGEGKPIRGWAESEAFWKTVSDPMGSVHYMTNFEFDIRGDDATYTCMLFGPHWPAGADFSKSVPIYFIGGQYTVKAYRTTDGWRIMNLRFRPQWAMGDPTTIWPARQ